MLELTEEQRKESERRMAVFNLVEALCYRANNPDHYNNENKRRTLNCLLKVFPDWKDTRSIAMQFGVSQTFARKIIKEHEAKQGHGTQGLSATNS